MTIPTSIPYARKFGMYKPVRNDLPCAWCIIEVLHARITRSITCARQEVDFAEKLVFIDGWHDEMEIHLSSAGYQTLPFQLQSNGMQ